MSDGWKWKPRPDICAEIKADIEANCHERLGDKIEEAIAEGDEWRAQSLRNMAQEEFNKMVHSNGELSSVYADVRQAFSQYSALDGYQPYDRKTELEKQFDVTIDPETGAMLIHPKGMMNITPRR